MLRIGRYDVLGRIGSGGMAEVLLARLDGPGGFSKQVVIKRILPHLAGDSSFRHMFLDEARIASRLSHPNVAQVLELGRQDEDLFLVMEFVSGKSLAEVMRVVHRRQKQLPLAVAVHIAAEVAQGLHAAHELRDKQGQLLRVVHRDVSPQNILLSYDGHPKLIDFGIATALDRFTSTTTGELKGKLSYMAPEQCQSKPVDRRTDVYALGVVLHELVTGHRLFRRENALELIRLICREDTAPPSERRPDCPAWLDAIVAKAMHKDPARRFQTALEMSERLFSQLPELAPRLGVEKQTASVLEELFGPIPQEGAVATAIPDASDVPPTDPLLQAELGTDGPTQTLATGDLHPQTVATGGRLSSAESSASRMLATSATTTAFANAPTGTHTPAGQVEPRSRTQRMALVGVAAVLGLASLVALGQVGRTESDADVPAELANAPAEVLVAQSDPPGEPVTVDIEISTVPVGARILLDGEELGISPQQLSLPRSSAYRVLQVQREGFRDHAEQFTPSRDQRIRIALERLPREVEPTVNAAGPGSAAEPATREPVAREPVAREPVAREPSEQGRRARAPATPMTVRERRVPRSTARMVERTMTSEMRAADPFRAFM